MKRTISYLIASACILLLNTKVSAQNITDDLTKSRKFYNTSTHLSMNVIVNDISASPNLMGKGKINQSGENYYSRFMDDEILCNQRCALVIDHGSKTITYFGNSKNIERAKNNSIPEVKDLIDESKDSVVYVGIVGNEKKYTIVHKSNKLPIIKTELKLDVNDYHITELIYHYKRSNNQVVYGPDKVQVKYIKESIDQVNAGIYSEKKYIKEQKGKLYPTVAYSNYKILVANN